MTLSHMKEELLKSQGITEKRVREALQAGREHLPGASRTKDQSARAVRLAMERRYSERILEALRNGTCDHLQEFDKLRAEGQAEMRQMLQQQRTHLMRRSGIRTEELRREMQGWRRYNEHLKEEQFPGLNFNFVILDTPALVLPSQGINLVEAAPSPWNNVARITGQWSTPYPDNTTDSISYVFAWQNPSERYALINVESYLSVNGFCDAAAGPGYTYSVLSSYASLQLFGWWSNPPTEPPGQRSQFNYVLFLQAEGGGIFGLGDVETAESSGNYDVSYRMFAVPPKGVTVFTVSLYLSHSILEDGYIDVDYATGNFEVMCPAVIIAILS